MSAFSFIFDIYLTECFLAPEHLCRRLAYFGGLSPSPLDIAIELGLVMSLENTLSTGVSIKYIFLNF